MSSSKVEHAGSQLENKDAAQKRAEKSVTRETSHVLISPYVARAVFALAHHADRAVSNDARSLKT